MDILVTSSSLLEYPTTDAQNTNAVRASHPNRIVLAEVLLSLFHARGMG
jgi:hypothetical protein